MPSSFPPKSVAVVTGANRGIGLEVVRQLARDHGLRVVLTARDGQKADTAASTLVAEGLDVVGAALDVTDADSVTGLAASLDAAGEAVRILVNNAGVFADRSSIFDADADELVDTFKTNTVGPFTVTKAFAPLLRKHGHGRVVMVSSGMGQLSEMGTGAPGYRLSKVGINALARIFAAELQSSGVLVNAACPGWVQTDMGGGAAPRHVSKGAASVVWAATLDDNGPTGGFFRDGQRIEW